MPILPVHISKENYRSYFEQTNVWLPAIEEICKRHSLTGQPERATLGSNIVFKVGNMWIKMIVPIYNGDMLYEVEGLKSVPQDFAYQTPRLVAHDHLEGWEYIVVSNVEGEPVRKLWPTIPETNKLALATSIGELIQDIQKFSVSEKVLQRFNWNQFISERFNKLTSESGLKPLPETWNKCLEKFVSQFSVDEFLADEQVFLHADLTYDHFLVSPIDFKLKSLIDFADCQAGHHEYELAAPMVFLFKSNRQQLRQFLIAAGIPEQDLNQRFSQKMIMWCLLHRYFGFEQGFAKELEQCSPGNFLELADRIFPL